eukprot:scaffold63483_cov69-Phaeocystis_antarctica.AAC.3
MFNRRPRSLVHRVRDCSRANMFKVDGVMPRQHRALTSTTTTHCTGIVHTAYGWLTPGSILRQGRRESWRKVPCAKGSYSTSDEWCLSYQITRSRRGRRHPLPLHDKSRDEEVHDVLALAPLGARPLKWHGGLGVVALRHRVTYHPGESDGGVRIARVE